MQISAIFHIAKIKKPQFDQTYVWGVYQFANQEDGKLFNAVGVLPTSALHYGLPIELIGQWVNSKYGRQFNFTTCIVERPSGEDGMIAFLQLAPGIGKTIAINLWDTDSESVIQALRERRLYVKPEVLKTAGECYLEHENASKHIRPLITLLAGIAFPKETPQWAFKHLRGDPVAIISANPFVLMKAPRVSFTLCDVLRAKLSLPATMPERYAAAMLHIFKERSSDTWLEKRYCIDQLCKLTESTAEAAVAAIVKLLEDEELLAHDNHLGLWSEASIEYEVCRRITAASQVVGNWYPVEAEAHLSSHQLEQLQLATGNGQVAVLLGSAGTGKTTTAAAVVQSFGDRVIACAPTGKAAQRLSAGFARLGLPVRAETVHRTLKAIPHNGGWHFRVDGQTEMLSGDLLVVDEVGMMTNYLLHSLLRAVPSGMPVLCLGDPHQLPPIGRGTFLRDWQYICQQDSGFQMGMLTEVHRNAGLLEHLCAVITKGQTPQFPTFSTGIHTFNSDMNVMLYGAASNQAAKANLLRFFLMIKDGTFTCPDGTPIDPIRDVQVVVPMNDNGSVSRRALNEDLQKVLNQTPSDHPYYRPYDKVICLQNGFYQRASEPGQVYVANGEMGYVTLTSKSLIHIRMSLTGEVIRYGCRLAGPDFDKAYAVTCHKMQGDQAPIVVTVLNHGYSGIMNREWFYTALTRAQDFSLVIGNQSQIKHIIDKIGMWERKSFMPDWFTGKELTSWTPSLPPSQS